MFIFVFVGCSQSNKDKGEQDVIPKVPVTTTGIQIGEMVEETELNATSAFFDKALITAPVAGYIEQDLVNPGDHVTQNQILACLRTRESMVLRGDSANPLNYSGLIRIKSSLVGTVISVDHPKGDYVQEGNQICSIAIPGSLVFILEAPFELSRYIKLKSVTRLFLPDGKSLNVKILSRLPMMTGTSQTQRFILQPLTFSDLPENLIARIRIIKQVKPHAVKLSKSCVLSDEVQQHFWVMKLINDSTAVKVDIKPGLKTLEQIEILEPEFLPADRFLESGNYGLGDTARIIIKK
jgi:biotin carboxyl carrier protein